MAIFEMLDMNNIQLYEFYNNNKSFFSRKDLYFYLKNDKEKNPFGNKYGAHAGFSGTFENGEMIFDHFAVVLKCQTSISEKFRNMCSNSKDGLVRFKLNDGISNAYVSILKNNDGTESVGFVIENKPQTLELPFSKKGYSDYFQASQEVGTLPWMVRNDKFLEMIPEDILKLTNIKLKNQKDQLLEELEKIDEQLDLLWAQEKELNNRKTEIITFLVNEKADDKSK